MSVTIVLADSELELVPERASRCARALPVLDAYFHQDLMKWLPEVSRRGRPDIVHNSLQLLQASAAVHEGRINVLVHTRHDQVIEVKRDADVAPNYIRFLRDMGDILNGKAVAGYVLTYRSFAQLISDLNPDAVLALSPHGQEVPLERCLHDHSGREIVVVIGGFPEGDYRSPVYEVAGEKISLGPSLMRVPEVVTRVLEALLEKDEKRKG